jgi:hypothetical protein
VQGPAWESSHLLQPGVARVALLGHVAVPAGGALDLVRDALRLRDADARLGLVQARGVQVLVPRALHLRAPPRMQQDIELVLGTASSLPKNSCRK